MEHPLQQDVVFSRFAALYLPQLIEKYLHPPEPSTDPVWRKSIAVEDMQLANAYGYMLVHLNGNPYFNKFFRLPENLGKRRQLIMALLQRLHDRTDDWEQRLNDPKKQNQSGGIAIPSMIYDFCQLTTSLLLFESEEKVYELTVQPFIKRLMPFLQWWNDRFSGGGDEDRSSFSSPKAVGAKDSAAEYRKKQWPAYQLSMVLRNGWDKYETMALREARLNKGSMNVCGMEGCSRTHAEDGLALFQCSKCGTVRYVSVRRSMSSLQADK